MKVIESRLVLQKLRQEINPKFSIGFVPTMGALHAGHAELIKRSTKENDLTVLSIFVNPTQFNNMNDFQNYPITWESDLKLAAELKVDAVFAPKNTNELYPEGYHIKVTEDRFSKILCGAHRPGHFDGVLSVVMKLFNLVRPTRAYFGEKDYQQLTLIRNMVNSYFMNLEIRAVPTVRESSGLAMSSRNLRLSPEELVRASKIFDAISNIQSVDTAKEALEENGFIVDYLEDHMLGQETRRFVAATLGKVRLIDNVAR